MISLTKEEYEDLASLPLGEDDANSQPGGLLTCSTTIMALTCVQGPIRVAENTCDDQAIQVNGSVCDSGAEVTHVQIIERNQARGQSIQMNGSMNGNALGQVLASRNKAIEAMEKSGQRQQPPPVHQQLVNGPRQARSYSPRPNYGRHRAIKRHNPLINGTRGVLGQVAMTERRLSVVVSQSRADDDGARNRVLAPLDDTSSNRDERAS